MRNGPVLSGRGAPTPTEDVLAGVLADVIGTERVPVDSHFFDDLGADSMVMARFCARIRKRVDVPPVSMKDIYRHPTIAGLAAALAPVPVRPEVAAVVQLRATAPDPAPQPTARRRTSTWQYLLCGTLQFLLLLGSAYLTAVVAVVCFEWISAGSGLVEVYLRSVVAGGASFLGLCALPILAKWLLIGRWTPRQIPVWSLAYVRFWIVKTLVRANPLVLLMVGSPLYPLYLRALGANVGRDVAIFSRTVPVCTDLLTIGAGTVVCKDSFLTGYRALSGMIETGSVTIGRDVFVGEATVLDIETSLGDGAQLGHVVAARRSGGSRRRALARLSGAAHRGGLPGGRPGRLQRREKGRVRRPAAAGRAAAVRAPDGRRRDPAARRGPPARRAPEPRTPGSHGRDVLPRRAGGLPRAVLRLRARRPLRRGRRPAGAQPRDRSGPRLSPLRLPLPGSPVDRAHDQRPVLHLPLRRQLGGRPLSALPGISPLPRGADRVELRPGGEAREPVLELGRQRDGGRRRVVNHECRFLELLLPGDPGIDRAAQLPRQQRRLSRAGQDGRQLPPRDEGHGAHRRARPGGNRAAGLPQLRDPAVGPARQPVRPPQGRGRTAPPSRRQEQAQRRHHRAVPAGAVGPPVRDHPARGGRDRPLPLVRSGGRRAGPRPRPRVQRRLFRAGRMRGHPIPGAEPQVLLDLRAVLLVARTILEGAGDGDPAAGLQTAPRSRTRSGACWVCRSGGACSTTAPRSRRGRW